MIKYHVKWFIKDYHSGKSRIGKEVVEENNLGAFIMGLVNDEAVIIQCEPIG